VKVTIEQDTTHLGHDLDGTHLLSLGSPLDLYRDPLLLPLQTRLFSIQLSDGSVDRALVLSQDLLQRLLLSEHVAHGAWFLVVVVVVTAAVAAIGFDGIVSFQQYCYSYSDFAGCPW